MRRSAEASVVSREERVKRVLHVHRLQRVQRRSEIRSHAVSQKDTNLLASWVYRRCGRGRRAAGPRHWPAGARLRRRRCRRRRRVASAPRPADPRPYTPHHYNYLHPHFKLFHRRFAQPNYFELGTLRIQHQSFFFK